MTAAEFLNYAQWQKNEGSVNRGSGRLARNRVRLAEPLRGLRQRQRKSLATWSAEHVEHLTHVSNNKLVDIHRRDFHQRGSQPKDCREPGKERRAELQI